MNGFSRKFALEEFIKRSFFTRNEFNLFAVYIAAALSVLFCVSRCEVCVIFLLGVGEGT